MLALIFEDASNPTESQEINFIRGENRSGKPTNSTHIQWSVRKSNLGHIGRS